MMPNNAPSTEPVPSAFAYRVRRRTQPLIDYEQGGAALRDASKGYNVKLWTLEYRDGGLFLSAEDVDESLLFSRSGVTRVGLGFTQGMVPVVAFEDGDGAWIRYYDNNSSDFVLLQLPSGSRDTCCTLDDHRLSQTSSSDVIVSYLRGTNLYFVQQRESYAVERQLSSGVSALTAIGMSVVGRLQFRINKE